MEARDKFHAPDALPHGKGTHHTHRLEDWVDLEPTRTFRRKEKSLASAENRTPDRPVRSLVNMLSTLYWLPVTYRAVRNLHFSADIIVMIMAR